MKAIVWIIVILIIVGGGWWYFTVQPAAVAPTTDTTTEPAAVATDTTTPDASAATSGAPMTANVIYGPQGFSPKSVTIAKGGSVMWVNEGGANMWVASDQHPSHTGYAGTTRQQHCPDTSRVSFDECAPGSDYSFTFQKPGMWEYHNHMKATHTGTVIVE